ncbi:hypothetical protein I6E17_02355 [Fusobacterium perfoetens]|uniref:hypothetical protein n=1 Tax=Fusobacterium perfoetens TaxID=852 RepID=UPI001F26EDEB|nr:hypothetical protein [Fusobacterium perfoetens]MCF2625017.1 hypothetical protein [Fusobacterium perfoetens]
MEDKKEQGIFIPFEIWTIKNLNINEKLVLSDIYNKEIHSGRTEYNAKAETLSEILSLNTYMIKIIFENLKRKKYISCNPERFTDGKGRFKTGISRRYINYENFKNAERFIIPENNIFLRNGEKGIYLNISDLYFLNAWSKTKTNEENEKIKLRAKITNKHLILFLIIKKIAFFHGELYNNLFARFNIKDIVEFTGMVRQTISPYIKALTEKDLYNKKQIRFLYDLSKEHIYNELFNKLEDTTVLTDYKKNTKEIEVTTIDGEIETISIGNMENLYYINIEDMEEVGINVFDLLKNKK